MGSWIDSLFQRESLPVTEAAMGFYTQKQSVIMNNIANVETPYYKRQTLPEQEFQGLLKEAITERGRSHPASFQTRDIPDIAFKGGVYPSTRMLGGREWGPERHDENSVVVEKEMADLAENALMITALQKLVKKKLTMMEAALKDRVG